MSGKLEGKGREGIGRETNCKLDVIVGIMRFDVGSVAGFSTLR
jgi:hypothetical protein